MAEVTEVVRCRRLEVVDEDDVVRFSVECTGDFDDAVIVQTFGPKSTLGFAVIHNVGGPSAQAWFKGNEVAALSLDEDGDLTVRRGA